MRRRRAVERRDQGARRRLGETAAGISRSAHGWRDPRGFTARGWLALVAPVGTPDAIVRKLSDDLRSAVTDPATKTKLETTGNYPNPMTPDEVRAFIRAEQESWKPVVEHIARNP
jgi:Tripartite tricarboxylate transporter family receptor